MAIGDPDSELMFLRLASSFPKYRFHLYNLEQDLFSDSSCSDLAAMLREFVRRYRGTPPTRQTFRRFIEDHPKLDTKSSGRILTTYEDMLDLTANPKEFEFFRERLIDDRRGRLLVSAAESILRSVDDGTEYKAVQSKALQSLLRAGSADATHFRGLASDTAHERWEAYERKAEGDSEEKGLSFGIDFLDRVTGGILDNTMTMFYAGTGGGKSRTMISIAVNVAECRNPDPVVAYFSLEMDKDFVLRCFDSRVSMLDAVLIRDGKLPPEDAARYKATLKKHGRRTLSNIYVVDIPGRDITVNQIHEEIEILRVDVGKYPDLIIIDYAGLMQPVDKVESGRSERYDLVFRDLVSLLRMYRIPIITAMQESREYTKKGSKYGVHNVGYSSAPAQHCNNVFHLVRDEEEELGNRIRVVGEKTRDGKPMESELITFQPEFNFVGDRKLRIPREDGERSAA